MSALQPHNKCAARVSCRVKCRLYHCSEEVYNRYDQHFDLVWSKVVSRDAADQNGKSYIKEGSALLLVPNSYQ